MLNRLSRLFSAAAAMTVFASLTLVSSPDGVLIMIPLLSSILRLPLNLPGGGGRAGIGGGGIGRAVLELLTGLPPPPLLLLFILIGVDLPLLAGAVSGLLFRLATRLPFV